jgi:hypothetical protein
VPGAIVIILRGLVTKSSAEDDMMRQITMVLVSVLLVATDGQRLMSDEKVDEVTLLALANKATAEEAKILAKAEVVFTATLAKATEGAVAKSLPPIRYYALEFTNVTSVRGQIPADARWEYGVRSMKPPEFNVGGVCTVAARKVGGEFRIELLLSFPRVPKVQCDSIRQELERLRQGRGPQIDPMPR